MAFPSRDKISNDKVTSAHIVSLLTSPAGSSIFVVRKSYKTQKNTRFSRSCAFCYYI